MFNSVTGQKARKSRTDKKKEKDKNITLKVEHAENQRFKNKFYQLKDKFLNYVKESKGPHLWSSIMEFCKEKYNILYDHISNIHVSSSNHGNRFQSEKLRQFFILISFHGRSLMELLKKTFAFPSWKSTMRWKKSFLQQYNISFDGSIESLSQLISTIYKDEMNDNRVVIAIDAVSVSPNISVSMNGEVTGLVHLNHIDESDAIQIIRSPEDFASFVESHANQAIRYFFVLYLCPLNPNYISIPICIIPQETGNANKSITKIFDDVLNNLKTIGMDIIGEAYDGDPGWLSRTNAFVQELSNLILLHPELTLEDLAELAVHVNSGRFIYEDLLHLTKCDRYRKVSGASICPTLYEANATINKESFEQSGIPKWITDNNHYTKMDDTLPIKFFTLENIQHLREIERFDLSFSLMPSTLLIEAVLNDNYSKSQRLDLLSFGYSIIYIYYTELQAYTSEGNIKPQSTSKSKGEGKCVTLFEKKFCQKYMALCASLSNQISKKGCVDLGALGSHHLEHFFGSIRRVSKGNDCSDKFLTMCYDAILRIIISNNLQIDSTEIKRKSSSGFFIEEEEEVTNSHSIIDYIKIAWCLFSKFRNQGDFFDLNLFKLATENGEDLMSEEEAFGIIESILQCGQSHKNIKIMSTKKEKMIIRSGLTNDKRLAESKQISKMIARSQTPSTLIIEVEESKVKASTNIPPEDSDDEQDNEEDRVRSIINDIEENE